MASQATAMVIPGSPAPSYRSVDGEQRKFQLLVLVSFNTRTFGKVKKTLCLQFLHYQQPFFLSFTQLYN